ncbi:hypothetical protein PC129_g13848 [Phytophthora cactorum]|uniref:Uncharacterized protein n=1 Tax=Phytophthora cactorum TaxID=29920 RepID=A0A8T0YU02_9STRA|nr:hypothetical protein Pcac1_g6482 [Phytophthora cactorum]KAG2840145.1 hypothetical protein PC112_g3831 [Phytophthora cactorum]KAG2846618.1 hypothetical protein PC111_g1101 [Phytophthora cactorum]KAG2851841.1 hypothetical protein PC113_g15564 [Phytophthora cactorum]KAG2890985.1 hypothetical protein PC114_g17185 [Phytophthora cactorum]
MAGITARLEETDTYFTELNVWRERQDLHDNGCNLTSVVNIKAT